jgi:flagellar basal body rod protein FlgG
MERFWHEKCKRILGMDFTSTVLAGGLRSRAENLDILAHNVANANATAFKAEREQYQMFVPDWVAPGSAEYDAWAKSPELRKSHVNFTQGSLDRTDGPLDLAIEGNGFFVVEAGPDAANARFLTRDGAFQLGQDGQIRNREGLKLKLVRIDGGPLDAAFRLDPNQPVSVRRDGIVSQNGTELARVQVTHALEPQALARDGNSYFAWDSKNSAPQVSGFALHQGMLERSNYDPLAGSVQLVNISRQFEMLQKALQLHSEMGRRVSEEIGKV